MKIKSSSTIISRLGSRQEPSPRSIFAAQLVCSGTVPLVYWRIISIGGIPKVSLKSVTARRTSLQLWNITQDALRVIVKASPYTFFIGSKSWDLLSSEPPRGDSSATESRFATSWVIRSPQRKRPLKSELCGGQFLISAVW